MKSTLFVFLIAAVSSSLVAQQTLDERTAQASFPIPIASSLPGLCQNSQQLFFTPVKTVMVCDQNNSWKQATLPEFTVAQLPAITIYPKLLAKVTDGLSATDCTVGGGSTILTCAVIGGVWSSTGGGGGGGGVSTGTVTQYSISQNLNSSFCGNIAEFIGVGGVNLVLANPVSTLGTCAGFGIINTSAGNVTINVNGLTLRGSSSNLVMTSGTSISVFIEGANYTYSTGLQGPQGTTGSNGTNGTDGNNSPCSGVSPHAVSYLLLSGDAGHTQEFNGSSLTATLPAVAPSTTWATCVQNQNASNLTLSPNGVNLNGSTSSLVLVQYQTAVIWTDGSVYYGWTASGTSTTPTWQRYYTAWNIIGTGAGIAGAFYTNPNGPTSLYNGIGSSLVGIPLSVGGASWVELLLRVPDNYIGSVNLKTYYTLRTDNSGSGTGSLDYSVACGTPGAAGVLNSAFTFSTPVNLAFNFGPGEYQNGKIDTPTLNLPTCVAGDIMMIRMARPAGGTSSDWLGVVYFDVKIQ